ncbi:MAG: hypothetical protein PVH85_17060 [Desulfobacterales bacterium]|jgi:hypothetical protein
MDVNIVDAGGLWIEINQRSPAEVPRPLQETTLIPASSAGGR